MLTGTPLDMTPFGSIVNGIGWLYWLLALGLLVLAVCRPKTLFRKALWSMLVLAAFGVMPAIEIRDAYAAQARLRAAQAHFEMRCKSAGEKISRTVENVEGVVWMKWRDKIESGDDRDQFKLFDPYGRDCSEQGCIEQLLRVTQGQELDPEKKKPFYTGYQFVESTDPRTQKAYQYTRRLYRASDRDPKYGKWVIESELVPQPSQKMTARYGITWDDIPTRGDREHWIAGGSIKVIDLQNNEVIAERLGFLIDKGQGDTGGFRSPWGWARSYSEACPPLTSDQTTRFALKVLRPTKHAE
jgi:hypothetical protein